jgi:hypothetical protein
LGNNKKILIGLEIVNKDYNIEKINEYVFIIDVFKEEIKKKARFLVYFLIFSILFKLILVNCKFN